MCKNHYATQKTKNSKPSRLKYEIGKTYGDILIIGESYDRGYRRCKCRCLKCGYEFETSPGSVTKKIKNGCNHCIAIQRRQDRMKEIESYIGQTFGSLVVTGFGGFYENQNGSKSPAMMCHCNRCGSDTVIPLTRLKTGGAKSCVHCRHTHLADGRELKKEYHIDGTSVCEIDGTRALNKNNSTGYTGVCVDHRSGKYRSYITFKRTQYDLGLHDTIEEAAQARKTAEENIYGEFLHWYSQEYPEQWDRLQKKKRA